MINCVGKMCVATMSLCMIVLIVTRKKGEGRYIEKENTEITNGA